MEGTVADIRCPSCGAPARFDILKGEYRCGYCGGQVGIQEALAQRQGFRSIQQQIIRESAANCHLASARCTGCGAELIFEESEALANCAFCGRALVRKEYLAGTELPELIVPFRITQEEAVACLEEWRRRNAGKAEAKHMEGRLEKLKGFYLPYELVRGPVSCKVSRMDANRSYECRGYVDNVFVNCSKQLDNLLLDAMEPFELDELQPFDFAYAAGQRIKVGDVSDQELKKRVSEEVSSDYTPTVRNTLETQTVDVRTNVDSVLRMPVLLPVYYIAEDGIMAAVNGQTGKVSVRAEKPSHAYFIPWWAKSILATAIISGVAFAAFMMFGMVQEEALVITGVLAIFTIIVSLAVYSDSVHNSFQVETVRKIFTSSGGPLRRMGRNLVQDAKEIKKEITPPAFFETLDGESRHVKLVFHSTERVLRIAVLAIVALFLPVLVALLLNGFDFAALELGGSAVWFCIMVPVVPIYILKFAVVELYDNPWIYLLDEGGRMRRYHSKDEGIFGKITLRNILDFAFIPPGCLAVWIGIAVFILMCYLTAFGFE